MSCPSCSQHTVLIRYMYTYLWSFVTIFLKVQKLSPINNILPRTVNSTVKIQVIVFVDSTWIWWDQSFWDFSLKLHKSIPSGYRVMTLHSCKLTTDERADKHDDYRTITFTKACNVLKVIPSEKKQHTMPNGAVCSAKQTKDFFYCLFGFY